MAVDYTEPHRTTPARALLQRLMIRCPVTGLATDTGLDLTEVPVAGGGAQLLVDCQECGQDHPWRIDDALLPR